MNVTIEEVIKGFEDREVVDGFDITEHLKPVRFKAPFTKVFTIPKDEFYYYVEPVSHRIVLERNVESVGDDVLISHGVFKTESDAYALSKMFTYEQFLVMELATRMVY